MMARLFILLFAWSAFAQDQTTPQMSKANPEDAAPITPLDQTLVVGTPQDDTTPDLILIPGIGLSLDAWRSWMEANADRYRMHAVTLPGMAGTAPPPLPDPPTSDTPFLDNAAAAIAAYIEANDLDRPIIIGHGTGGMVAMLMGIRHPELVGGVASITMAPAVPVSREPMTQAERAEQAFAFIQPRNASMSEADVSRSIQNTYLNALPPSELRDIVLRDAAACEPHVLTQYWPEVVFTDLIDEIAANESLPLLLCLPGAGPFRNAQQWHAIADAADSIMLIEFPGSRSFCHYDNPAQFQLALQALIERTERLSAPRD
ncbi:MAG: alpha/beta hydrolase [Planctomycetota bacterium]